MDARAPRATARRAAWSVLSGLALILVALAFGSALLFVPGAAFVLLGLGAYLWVSIVAGSAVVDRTLHAERVIEDDPFEATIEVHGGPLGVAGIEVLDPLAGKPFLLRGRSRAATVRVVARFDRRGLRVLQPPAIVVRDPLMLALRQGRCRAPRQQVLVLPRVEPIRWLGGSGGSHPGSVASISRVVLTAAVEVDGLRPYRPGTPASRIYWPALARGTGLLERHLRGDDDVRPLVILDLRGDVSLEQADAAVRAAGSLTLELGRTSGCLLLEPGERRATSLEPDLVGWPSIHARLALTQSGPGAPAPTLSAARSRIGPVLYVAASPLDRAPAALGLHSIVLVVPMGAGPRRIRPSFEVAGCLGYPITARSRAPEAA
jgi:uncharacterized protein (DUF58 family)